MASAPNTTSFENNFFYEDEVYSLDKKGRVKFGLVMENFEGSSSDNEDDFLNKGEIRVAWHPNGDEEIINERAVGLADRTLMPGDVVRRLIPGKDTQRGYCRDIFVKADVRILGSKYVLKNVAADRLRPLNSMPRDNAVCLDSWVGSTKSVDEKLVLKSTCGSILELRPNIEYFPLRDTTEMKTHNGCYAGGSFYPGQMLVGPVSALDNAKWITTSHEMRISRKHKTVDRKFIVQSVETEGVYVHWQCKALSDENEIKAINAINGGLLQPKCFVTGDDLKKMKRLNLFESCMLQINDNSYLKIELTDLFIKKSSWLKDQGSKYRVIQSQNSIEDNSLKKDNLIEENFENSPCDKFKITKNDCDLYKSKILTVCADKTKLCPNKIKNANLLKERQNEAVYKNKSPNTLDCSSDWITEDDSDDSMSNSTTLSSCSSPTPKSSPKRSPLMTKRMKKLKKKSNQTSIPEKPPSIDEEVVTEALVVYSTATVVWQDGTIEKNIPSTQLYPIHHLDDHEFFPGDFVLAGTLQTGDDSHREYGVIQVVDHQGRTALVNWYRTYTCFDEPKPTQLGESEVSVYDLKDHPDFQYRPGTIVIRVANFIGIDTTCTAGQVIDNYPDGMVNVWWVDGHSSLSWPQDLFEVGQYDSDNNFWSNGESDNESWETESENSEFGDGSPLKNLSKPDLSINLERARVAMARLEEIFNIYPNLQNQDIMKKLLGVYKKCRYLDRLMNTTYFHEDHFLGLLERVRKGGNATTAERVQDQMNRLFNQTPSSKSISDSICTILDSTSPQSTEKTQQKDETKKSCKKKLEMMKSESKSNDECSQSSISIATSSPKKSFLSPSLKRKNLSTSSDTSVSSVGDHNKLFNCVISNIDKVLDGKSDDSGNFSRHDPIDKDGSTASNISSMTDGNCLMVKEDDLKSSSFCSIDFNSDVSEFVCAKLCALLKQQLVKALQEINQRFCQSISLSEIVVEESGGDEAIICDDKIDDESETIDDTTASAMDVSIEEIESVVSSPMIPTVPLECFLILETAPNTHKFHLTMFQPIQPQQFFKAVRKEHKLLKTALPPGVWIRLFEDRSDLLSVMIEGPKKTPYEDGMFLFDIQLGKDYPATPPLCHYISYCSDRLNPNLYEDGKVCVSLLGTWSGRGSEMWGPESTLLQVIVSIQGLILVSEPYFNEAGYEKQKGTQQGKENSRMYNEMVVLKLLQSMSKLISSPPEIFREQILQHFTERGEDMFKRINIWMELSNKHNNLCLENNLKTSNTETPMEPDFPLVPASRGFCLTLAGLLESFHKNLQAISD